MSISKIKNTNNKKEKDIHKTLSVTESKVTLCRCSLNNFQHSEELYMNESSYEIISDTIHSRTLKKKFSFFIFSKKRKGNIFQKYFLKYVKKHKTYYRIILFFMVLFCLIFYYITRNINYSNYNLHSKQRRKMKFDG
jgi:hypothetical protein